MQRKFLKILNYKFNYVDISDTYDAALLRKNLISCVNKRTYFDCMLLYKILHNKIDTSLLLQYLCFNVPNFRARNVLTFNLPCNRTSLRASSPMNRLMTTFNSRCNNIDIFTISQPTFRKILHDSFRT